MEKNKKELKKNILTDNKSGFKSRKEYYSKHFPNVLFDLENFVKNNSLDELPFITQLYHYIEDIKEIPKCSYCNKDLIFKRSFNEGYGQYCSISCTNKSEKHINNSKLTNIKRYGGVSPNSSIVVKEKTKKTNIERYGVDNIFKNTELIQRKINEKYGNPIISKTEHYKTVMKNKYLTKYDKKNIDKVGDAITYECTICNNISEHDYNSFNYRNRNNIDLCKICVPPYQSMIEEELENFLKTKDLNFDKHIRTIIPPKEIDFFYQDKKIGIELNGLYHHSEAFVENNYHQNKWLMSEKNGIQLIQIWEDEWKLKKELVKKLLLNKLNLVESNLIYGRKCEIKLIDNNVYKYFVEEFHLQGYAPAKIRLGLFYENNLIQVMSFSSNRKSMGSKNIIDHYEMIRLCTNPNFKIIGGSQKILKYFEKLVKPKKITTYCDVRFFTGDTYLKMGFEYKKLTKPNYFYYKPNELKRYSRFNFRKDKLIKMGFDQNMSEKEIMKNIGYYRIYDAGNKKFEKIY